MLRPRIIPCLLVRENGLVKTEGFSKSKYVGDPINAVKIFNEKEADELIILDIDATVQNADPNYQLIRNFAAESRMPLCYGGGIKTPEQAKTIIGLGVEKISISSAAVQDPELIARVSEAVGNQSVVVVLDIKVNRGRYEVWTHNGRVNSERTLTEVALQAEQYGAGEIVLNSIQNDGLMMGYDFGIVDQVKALNVPLTVLGGAGSLKDIGKLISRYGIIGAAAGSLFVFKGKYRAVLINYPSAAERDYLIKEYLYADKSRDIWQMTV